jgi:hypothetical protein
MPAKKKGFNLEININTILGTIGTILGGIIVWFATHAMQTAADNGKTLMDIKYAVPGIQKDIGDLKIDVRAVQAEQTRIKQVYMPQPKP